MRVRVQLWGSGLAIRIPQSIANDAGIFEGSIVKLTAQKHGVVVQSVRQRYRLADLLAGVTRSNRHGAADAGDPVGGESL